MADIATAYVQIVPSARGMGTGISNVLNGEMPGAGKSAGSLLGSNIASTVKRVIAAAGIGEALRKTLTEGAELEQLKGGVEKIFNDMDASVIFADAANAYKDLNMSVNQYLATINDVGAAFSATMGDEKGYNVAKTGLQAISDYASGTGKSVDVLSEKFAMITRSTSSYQSIADQFSGILPATSADFLKQAQSAGLLEKKYRKLTDVPVAQYQEAVAIMLERGTAALGLTGNTAAETANTFSGSLAAMKASLSNVLGVLSTGGDVGESVKTLASTTVTFLKDNLVPAIKNVVTALPEALGTFLDGVLPSNLTGTAVSMINSLGAGLDSSIPQLLSKALPIVTEFSANLRSNAGALVDAGIGMIMNLGQGLINSIPTLVQNVPQIITNICGIINDNAPKLLQAGLQLIWELGKGIIQAGPTIIENFPAIIESIMAVFSAANWLKLGSNAVKSIGNGIKAASPSNVLSSVQNIVTNFTNGLKTHLPKIVENGTQVIINFIQGISQGLPSFIASVGSILQNFPSLVKGILPTILSNGASIVARLVSGISSAIPSLLSVAGDLLSKLLAALVNALPSLMANGAQMIASVASGIISNLPAIVSGGASVIAELLSTFAAHLPDLLTQGIALITQLIAGLISMIPDVITGAGEIIRNIINAFGETDWLSIGSYIISGIANGITDGVGVIVAAARDAAQRAFDAAKALLGIKSPSRLFRAEIGYRISQGAALGVTDGIPLMTQAMTDLTNATNAAFTSRLRMGASPSGVGQTYGRQVVINQYIYSQAQTAADLMREARYEAEKAVLLGV